MSYQNIGTPRFFIDHGLWYSSSGLSEGIVSREPALYQLNPSHQHSYESGWVGVMMPRYVPINYAAILGHNVYSVGGTITVSEYDDSFILTNNTTESNVVNLNGSTQQYDGFSICTFVDVQDVAYFQCGISSESFPQKVGAVSIGNTYTMPHSPDLSLTLSYDYGGIKTIETKGGASLSNAFYTKPPMWGNKPPWELYQGTMGGESISRSGRRVWNLSFSYLQDSDLFPGSSNINWFGSYDTSALSDGNMLLDDDSFYSQVIHKTNGGQLPFIFQPDSSNNNSDQFVIAKFDMKNFSFKQVANGVYNVKLKIREVW